MEAIYISVPATHVPETTLSIEDLARTERFSNDAQHLRDVEQFDRISVAADATLTELAILAGRKAIAERGDAATIGMALYTHHWEDEAWNNIHPFRVHNELALVPTAEVVELRNGNGGGVLRAIDLGARLLRQDRELGDVLLVTADKVNRLVMRRRFANSVFGDAAAAALLSRTPGGFRIESALHVAIFSRFNDIPSFRGVMEAEWVDATVSEIARGARALLEPLGVSPDRLAAMVATNMSPLVARRVAEAVGLSEHQLRRSTRSVVGQAVASELLLNLAAFAPERRPDDLVMLAAQGLGGSCHLLLLRAVDVS